MSNEAKPVTNRKLRRIVKFQQRGRGGRQATLQRAMRLSGKGTGRRITQ